ncbi:glycoside hydrolase family 3 C-terminal domain-containing protein [Ruficoccus sp. ZRK36]|uniref:beta-glucosidase n=1 Tax=Ruficoccus sp. ZRK36 TaxID=2866311 RepID=UPI001C7393B0|nr:glycoside hydrolase family 3 C-terminal domain-containing protein [Ruficoccus sp. ZRK36]QYY36875.1 glycoside hydrolase family 3 C-terminal domain-containing protein [Ruficoccus sp. ZRK36]
MNTSETNPQAQAEAILAQLSFEEKATLLSGNDTWHFGGVPRLGLQPLRVADCGHGLTFTDGGKQATSCLPTGVTLGATWDPTMLEQAGELLGRECRQLGVGILLGPMANLQRLPVGGRNFETYSEDPHLTAKMAGALIHGIQSTGTGACLKHLAGYAQIKHSYTHTVEIDEPTLHELYLRHFRDVVLREQPAALMTSYNELNGIPTAQHRELLEGFVREELNFEGMVVSDWSGVHSPTAAASGLDLEMPGPGKFLTPEKLRAEIDSGALTEDQIDRHVLRLLTAVFRYQVRSDQPAELDTPRHRSIAAKVAEAGIVLLKNERNLLPLKQDSLKRLAVIGPNAAIARLGGSGSASVTPSHAVSPLEGLQTRLADSGVEIVYAEGCPAHGSGPVLKGVFGGGLKAEYFNNTELADGPVCQLQTPTINYAWGWAAPAIGVQRGSFSVRFTGTLQLPALCGECHLLYEAGGVRVSVGGKVILDRWIPDKNTGFEDRFGSHDITLDLPQADEPVEFCLEFRALTSGAALRLETRDSGQNLLLDEAVALAREADAVIVCAGLCNRFEGGGGDRKSFELPTGQDELIRAINSANPNTVVVLNGATAMAMPWLDEVHALMHAFYPGEEGGTALARLLLGDASPSGRLPVTLPRRLEDVPAMAGYPGNEQSTAFTEGLMMGYRYNVTHPEVAPLFPFGFGLTYSTFTYGEPRLSCSKMSVDQPLSVTVLLTNSGDTAAQEVVQLYTGASSPEQGRPRLELKAFQKVALSPGESREISLTLSAADLDTYSPEDKCWKTEAGSYTLQVGPHCLSGQTLTFEYC